MLGGIYWEQNTNVVSNVAEKILEASKTKTSDKKKSKKQAKKSGKEKADDAPSWAKQENYDPNKSADENARRVLDNKYGKGNWKKGAGQEYSKIKKWLQRSEIVK